MIEKDYDYFFGEEAQLRNQQMIRDFAKYKSQRVAIESFKKSKHSELMIQAQKEGIKSLGAQEAFAYSHSDYVSLIKALEIATRKEAELYFQIRMFENEIEVWRTEQANNRKLL